MLILESPLLSAPDTIKHLRSLIQSDVPDQVKSNKKAAPIRARPTSLKCDLLEICESYLRTWNVLKLARIVKDLFSKRYLGFLAPETGYFKNSEAWAGYFQVNHQKTCQEGADNRDNYGCKNVVCVGVVCHQINHNA